jgi:hypothetical protein
MPTALLPSITAILALVMAVALADQWRERRHAFQLIWAAGMAFFGIASGCEALAALGSWNEALYRTWYLAGAVLTPGWLGVGTAVLLARTRFGYTYAVVLALSGLLGLVISTGPSYSGAGALPLLYLAGAIVVAVAIGWATYLQDARWSWLATGALIAVSIVALVLWIVAPLPAPGYAISPDTGQPVASIIPGYLRLLTPILNITGALSLILGAFFSAYVFMPKRRVLDYSLDPGQSGDQLLFNLVISPVAITVNFVASLPGAVRALLRGRLHSRVPATILIAVGAIVAAAGDTLNRFGITGPFAVAKFLAVVLLLAGFLVSIEAFREIRIPFTRIRITRARQEHAAEPELNVARPSPG